MSRRLAPLALLAAALAPPADGQTLLREQARHVLLQTQLVPGYPDRYVGDLESIAIDDSGGVMVLIDMCQTPGLSFCSQQALTYGAHGKTPVPFLVEDEVDPVGAVPGAELLQIAREPRLGADGTVLTGVRWRNTPTHSFTFENDSAIYLGKPGALAPLMRTGDPAPGTTGAVYGPANYAFQDYEEWAIDRTGRAVFHARLTKGDVPDGTDNHGLFVGRPGNVSLLAREGEPVATGPTVGFLLTRPLLQVNAAGMIAFDASYQIGTGAPPVGGADDYVVLLDAPGVGIQELFREGDPSPWPGFQYTSTMWTSKRALNVHGEMFLRVTLQSFPFEEGLAIARTDHDTPVVRRYAPAPGISGATFAAFQYLGLGLSDDGRVVFPARIAAPGVTFGVDDSGIWFGAPGQLELLARAGDPAPGVGGLVWGDLWQISCTMNEAGHVDFSCSLRDPSGGDDVSSRWRYVEGVGLRLVGIADGAVHDLGQGESGALLFAPLIDAFGNGAGRPLGLREDGLAAYRVIYDWPLASVAVVDDEPFSSQPKAVDVSVGGSVDLRLNAGSDFAGDLFLVLGSTSGTSPGTPVGGLVLPLVHDVMFDCMLTAPNTPLMQGTLGTLDALGRAQAQIQVPAGATGLAGTKVNFAFVALASTGEATIVSNASRVALTP